MQAYWFLTVTQLLETPWFLIQPVAYIRALRHWIPLPIQLDLRVVCKNGSLAAWQQLRLIFINLIHLSASGFFYLSNERTFFQSRFFLLLAFIYSWIPLFLRILKLTFPSICTCWITFIANISISQLLTQSGNPSLFFQLSCEAATRSRFSKFTREY